MLFSFYILPSQNKDDGDLTVLGEILSCLPIDLRLGKLVVLGYLLGVMEEAIIIAAGLFLFKE